MTDHATLRTLAEAATPGPWRWSGNTATHNIALTTVHGGRCVVMRFARYGMRGAQPVFRDEALGVVNGSDLPIYEVAPVATSKSDPRVYRQDIQGIRHPDAAYIAALSPDVTLALLDELETLRAALVDDPFGPSSVPGSLECFWCKHLGSLRTKDDHNHWPQCEWLKAAALAGSGR